MLHTVILEQCRADVNFRLGENIISDRVHATYRQNGKGPANQGTTIILRPAARNQLPSKQPKPQHAWHDRYGRSV